MDYASDLAKYAVAAQGQAAAYSNAPQAAMAPPEPPLFMRLVQGAEAIAQLIASIEDRLNGVLTRAAGPMPTEGTTATAPTPQIPGHLGALDLRLTAALRALERIRTTVDRLERII